MARIMKELYPKLSTEIAALRDKISQLEFQNKTLMKQLAEATRERLEVQRIRQELYELKDAPVSPPSWIVNLQKKHSGKAEVPITIWSDWHYGEKIDAAQTGGLNEFNRTIAKRRIRLLVERTLDLAFNHVVDPHYPGIVVCLAGDLISGTIHEELRETNDGPVQVSILEVEEMLIWALTELGKHFTKVFVPCVVGNHGRTTQKPRAKNRVYESFEWNIFHHLRAYFANSPSINIVVPDETDYHFRIFGHSFLLTHGDSIGVKGGDGIIGAVGPISRGSVKLHAALQKEEKAFDTLIIGHYHSYQPRGDLIPVIVNGTLKGYDEFARIILRAPYSPPCQALWFMHPTRGVTSQWRITLGETKASVPSRPNAGEAVF